MQKNTKIGSITDSCGIVIALVYQHRDGVIDAGEIGETRDMNDLQKLLPKGFAFRPWKKDLRLYEGPLGKSTKRNCCLASNLNTGCPEFTEGVVTQMAASRRPVLSLRSAGPSTS